MPHVVILAGGAGTRFWPQSRKDRPKQFLQLAGDRTLIQQTFDRVQDLGGPDHVHVVTSEALAATVRDQLPELPLSNLIVEPRRRDTAIAVGLAAALIAARDPDAVLAVVPADHVIRPAHAFRDALREAEAIARSGPVIVTFGIPAREARTGYGYIRRGEPLEHAGKLRAFHVSAFEEKPEAATAERYVAGGEHAWNSGIFVWSAKTVLAGLEAHRPEVHEAVSRIARAWGTDEQQAVLTEVYEAATPISIDYALLEQAERVAVLLADFEWSDVGSWSAIPDLFGQDEARNTVRGAPFVAVDAEGCLVHGDGKLVALLGVKDLVIVQTRDATLVCSLDRVEEVKAIVSKLEAGELEDYT